MQFGLRHVRCFAKPDPVRIAPLTILVGENSTGKSSFLALLRIAQQIAQGDLAPDFNAEPFRLGAYDQIAHRSIGEGTPADSFGLSLSVNVDLPKKNHPLQTAVATFDAQFVSSEGQPQLSLYEFSVLDYRFRIASGRNQQDKDEISFDFPSWQGTFPSPSHDTTKKMLLRGFLPWMAEYTWDQVYMKNRGKDADGISDEDTANFYYMSDSALKEFKASVYPFAPVRTKPLRTYDPVMGIPQSEGTHVPTQLAHMEYTSSTRADKLKRQIRSFGQSSGLFDDLGVKTLGNSQGNPFQIVVTIADNYANLIDVGYGVSQVLPILVDLLDDTDTSRLYLLQQPEVHLHPRAQAQLGSFLGEIVTQTSNHIAVETHSDFLIDRVRMSIRDEETQLTAEDVSLLYFEHTGSEARIHEIILDSNGDIQDPPPSYRDFFMSELRRKFNI